MWRMLPAVLLLVGIAHFALAQGISVPGAPKIGQAGTGIGFAAKAPTSGGGGGGYSGPCDAATISGGCTSAVGFLSGTAAYSTALSPAVDICDTATCTTTATINFLATGYWDAATAAASAPCTVACSPSKFYDSTGNGNALPVNGTAYGQISFNVLGSCSGLIRTVISGPSVSNPYYLSSTFTTLTQPYSLITLAERIGNTMLSSTQPR